MKIIALLLILTSVMMVFPADVAFGHHVTARIPVVDSPMNLSSDGERIYASNIGERVVSIIHTKTDKLLDEFETSAGVIALEVVPEKDKIYLATFESGGIDVHNFNDHSYLTTINLPDAKILQKGYLADRLIPDVIHNTGGWSLKFNPNNDYLYVANYNTHEIIVIDTNSDTVVDSISVPRHPIKVEVDELTNTIVVASIAGSRISFIDASSNSLIKSIDTGVGPWGIGIDKDDSRAYITHRGEFAISVVDTNSHELIKKVKTLDRMHAVDVDSQNNVVYAGLMDAGRIVKLDGTALEILNVIETGVKPFDILFHNPTHKLYTAMKSANEVAVLTPNSISDVLPVLIEDNMSIMVGNIDAHSQNIVVSNAIVDVNSKKVSLDVHASEAGNISLRIPTEILYHDAQYEVLVDQELVKVYDDNCDCLGPLTDEFKQITFKVPARANSIEIIGTSVVPEFGTVAMIVLAISIVSVIALASKSNRLSLVRRF